MRAQCERAHSRYIEASIHHPDAVRAAADTIITTYLPALRQCVRERGFYVTDDTPYSELVAVDAAASEAQGTDAGCLESTGLSAALGGGPPQ